MDEKIRWLSDIWVPCPLKQTRHDNEFRRRLCAGYTWSHSDMDKRGFGNAVRAQQAGPWHEIYDTQTLETLDVRKPLQGPNSHEVDWKKTNKILLIKCNLLGPIVHLCIIRKSATETIAGLNILKVLETKHSRGRGGSSSGSHQGLSRTL